MLVVRSIVFNVLFYLNLCTLLLLASPTLIMPQRSILWMAKTWGRTSLWLLRVVCDLKVEFRGLEKITPGPLIIAAKHQSMWETFVLVTLFDHPTFIIKRELMWIPFFGWFTWKGGMIPVKRGAGAPALAEMAANAGIEIRRGRQLIIFPEGTRRAPGAEPRYRYGVTHLYAEVGVPCIPVALNSGLYWRRRSFLRWPGTVRVEFLDPIPPGLGKDAFLARLQSDIETATARLITEGEREIKRDSAIAPRERAT